MEVPFSPDIEEQLQRVAASCGISAADFVQKTIGNTLRRRAEFLAAVDRGIISADNGELIEHSEAMQRLHALLQT